MKRFYDFRLSAIGLDAGGVLGSSNGPVSILFQIILSEYFSSKKLLILFPFTQ